MAYIYCITNKINGKQYVGKTENTIDERWKEHKQDYKKERCEKRPLYDAMFKYGVENFEIKELEYLEQGGKLLSDREEYWIKQLGTYGHNGYNATKGGDGKTLYDHQEIIKLYIEDHLNQAQISRELGCSIDTIRDILNSNNIDVEKRQNQRKAKQIEQYSLDGKLLNTFNSCRQAAKYIAELQNKEFKEWMQIDISRVASGKRKTAYKFIWKFKQN